MALAEELQISLWGSEGKLYFRARSGTVPEEFRSRVTRVKSEIVKLLSGPQFRAVGFVRELPLLPNLLSMWSEIEAGRLGTEFTNSTHFLTRCDGRLDAGALQSSVSHLVRRHSILGAKVVRKPGAVVLSFAESADVSLRVVDLANIAGHSPAALQRVLTDLIWTPFDLTREPPFRPFAVELSGGGHILGFVVHHLLIDCWAVALLADELLSGYRAASCNRVVADDNSPFQFTDYCVAMDEWLRGPAAAYRVDYWVRRLKGTPDFRLLADSDVAQERDSNFAIAPFVIRSELVAALRAAVRSSSTTLFTIVMAAIVATIAHSTGSSEVTVLTVQSGREQLCLFHMVGAAAYVAALKMIVEERTSLRKLATQVQAALDVAMEYQVPFESVRLRLRELEDREFEVPLVNLSDLEQMPHAESLGSPVGTDISVGEAPLPELVSPRMPQFAIHIRSEGGALHGEILYRTSLYGGSTTDAFVSSLCRLLGSADLERPIADLLA
jgi:hypothetical protein